MEKNLQEQYEYARKRVKQKVYLYYHFVLFFLTSIFILVINFFSNIFQNWDIWLISFWSFLFILHFIKVFITDRFMNKNWERNQIEKLVSKQQIKINQFEKFNE